MRYRDDEGEEDARATRENKETESSPYFMALSTEEIDRGERQTRHEAAVRRLVEEEEADREDRGDDLDVTDMQFIQLSSDMAGSHRKQADKAKADSPWADVIHMNAMTDELIEKTSQVKEEPRSSEVAEAAK